MINKDKIVRVLIYGIGVGEKLLISTKSVYFPRDFFKIKGMELVMLKGSDFPVISKGDPIYAIFEYRDGTRVKYKTTVDLCTDYQMNFHIGEGEILRERRRSFKITVDLDGKSPFYIRGEEMFSFDDPVELHIINLNLGGVLFSTSSVFEPGDQVMLSFFDGEMQLLTEVLRIQKDENGNMIGYGCRFLNISQAQEEHLARFIIECQHMEIEKRRNKGKNN